jgi:hypothetical protein
MSGFLDRLDLEVMVDPQGRPLLNRAGRQLYKVLTRFRYLSDVAGLIDVPAGFITDLASFPQWALALLGDIAQYAAVPHDFVYNMHQVSRAVADKMLYEACLLTGVPKWKALAIYAGVRMGGGSHWAPEPAANDPAQQVA